MRFKSLFVTGLIFVSTLALPTALIVAPAMLTGCGTLGGGDDLLGTLSGLGQFTDRFYTGYQAGVDAGHLAGCAPKPLSVDELNAREQERLAKEAAAATTP